MNNTLKKYYFEGVRWIPGYNDFDFDDYTVTASSEPQAWVELDRATKFWKTVTLVSVTDIVDETEKDRLLNINS